MTTTVDHIGLNAGDFAKSKAFYAAALAPLGLKILNDFGDVVGMGADFPFLWISAGNPGHVHLAFRADSRKLVDEFYAAAIAAGGKDNGKPGLRPEYHQNYYGAFVLDPDGHNIEAVCHAPA
ncbi:MAG: glyoxalase [Devosia sp. 67-54]|mgnify:CR=1 FL=1|uniref:VOC family protein n=1 Tax=unclassified Devosia TaxID=196773 RepID=UPI00095ADE7F|nr:MULTISPECIES: VOC family protein [unclassified Devosia]MBN9307584.1 VOC family protein [Devosia sp.]OJX19990.1 MAG: glyoxalase [Devosia sp. 67-54]